MRAIIVFLISAAATDGCTPPQSRSVLATRDNAMEVEFYVAGQDEPAPKYRVTSFRRASKNSVELATRFQGLVARGLEDGEYEYSLEPEDSKTYPASMYRLNGKVGLWAPYPYWITLQMPSGILADSAPTVVSGRVVALPTADANQPFWIRFQHTVDASQVLQAKLDSHGFFRISSGLITGYFVITICRGEEVLHHSVARFVRGHPDHPLEIRVSSGAPATRREH